MHPIANAPFRLVVIATFLGVAPTIRADEFKWPDSSAGRCAAAYLEAYNAGTADQLTKFEAQYRAESKRKERPGPTWVAQTEEMRRESGPLRAKEIIDAGANHLKLLVEATNSGDFYEMKIEVEPQAPQGLTGIRMQGPIDRSTALRGQEAVDPETCIKTIKKISRALEKGYVFPETAKRMVEAISRKLESGGYNDIVRADQFAEQLTADLQEISHDKHLRVRVGSDPNARRGPHSSSIQNFGWARVEVLPGNVGYIKLNGFNPSSPAMDVAAGALAYVRYCEALVFDLRDNGGGSPEMIKFISSYLFDKPTHLNSFYNRREDSTTETWTDEKIPGVRFDKELPVYVLTSGRTFSAAEEFTYNLKNLKRATIVGETTGGGAHPVEFVALGSKFGMTLPYARAINPITKTNWEGVGVEPDIKVPAESALEAALQDASKKIAENRARGQEEE